MGAAGGKKRSISFLSDKFGPKYFDELRSDFISKLLKLDA
jgi:hypothetical protein